MIPRRVYLVVIDAKARTYTRYIGDRGDGRRCRRFVTVRPEEGLLTAFEVEQFRLRPETMIEPEAA